MQHRQRVHRGRPQMFRDLIRGLTGLSDDQCSLLIQMGGAYVGKFRCKDPGRLVRDGSMVSAYYRLPLVMEPVDFDPAWIVDRRDGLLLAAKPAGLPTQGRRDADYMAFYELIKQQTGGYVGLHHRLDQGTSGAMLFTTDKALNPAVAEVFRERKVQKTYLAIVRGTWQADGDAWLIDQPVGAVRDAGPTRYAVMKGGKEARTKICRLASDGDRMLLSVFPETGRTHQIRVHLQHGGLPIVGDSYYGGDPHDSMFLHCAALQWPDCGRLTAGGFHVPPPGTWSEAFPQLADHWQNEAREC